MKLKIPHIISSAGKKTTLFFKCLIRKVQVQGLPFLKIKSPDSRDDCFQRGRNVKIGLFGQALSILLLFSGCINVDNPSNIPEVRFETHEASYCIDNLGNENKCITLSFKLKDGDGNMGLLESDTIPPFTGIYQHNFYFDIWVYKNNNFEQWNNLAINYFNIPYLVPQGQNKILIADVDIDLSFSTSTLPYDTMKISFYVYDRDLNQSNIETTDTIFFQQNTP